MRQHVIVRIVALVTVFIFTTTSISWGQVGHPLRPRSQRSSVDTRDIRERLLLPSAGSLPAVTGHAGTVENPNRPIINTERNIKHQIPNLQKKIQNTHPATEEGVNVETRFIASFDDASLNDQQKTTDEHRIHGEGIESRRQIEMRNTDTEAQRRGETRQSVIPADAGISTSDFELQVLNSEDRRAPLSLIIKNLPAHCATIDSYHSGEGDDITVLIQDAHCHYDAQLKQAEIIKNLIEVQGFEGIYLEGASGPIDTAIFTAYPHKEVKEKVFTQALKEGVITGADYYAIMREGARTWMHGVEDTELYEKNYHAARELIQTVENPNRPNTNDQGNIKHQTPDSQERIQNTHAATEEGVHVETRFIASFNDQDDEYGGEIESPITDHRSLITDEQSTEREPSRISSLKSSLAILKNQIYSRRLKELDALYETYRPQMKTAEHRQEDIEKAVFELLEHLFCYIEKYTLDTTKFSEIDELKNIVYNTPQSFDAPLVEAVSQLQGCRSLT